MVRWHADTDRMLFIAIMEAVPIRLPPDALERVSQAFPPDPETGARPSPKAITERLYRMRTMMKRHGTLEKPRDRKKPEEADDGEPHDAAAAKICTPRTSNVSKEKVAKGKTTRTKRSKGTVNSDTGSDDDDEDYRPVKLKCSREAKALAKENPDFQRYGKHASPSRKRITREVRYNDSEAVKDEPLTEDDEDADRLKDNAVFHKLPESSQSQPSQASSTKGASAGSSQDSAPILRHTPVSSQSGSMNNSFIGSFYAPMTPNYPHASQPFQMPTMASHFYATPSGSFSASDYGSNSFSAPQTSRRDSMLEGEDSGNYNGFGHTYPLQSIEPFGIAYTPHGFDGQTSPITPLTLGSSQVPPTPPATLPTPDNGSHFAELKHIMSWPGFVSHETEMTGMTRYSHVATPPSASSMSASANLQDGPPGTDVPAKMPTLQRSLTDSDLHSMTGEIHQSNSDNEHFGQAGLGIDMHANFGGTLPDASDFF